MYIVYYRPQTKFAKVMFSQVSVCPQGGVPPGQVHPLGRYTPQGRDTPWAGTPPRQVHPPGRYTPLAGTPPRQVQPPGRYPWQVHPPGQVHPPTTVHAGIRSTSGRYASHWNAFLLDYDFLFFTSVNLLFVQGGIIIGYFTA